mmetsp:Transcript_5807/g.7406  ORF Transcript_5807/g.7406 Transcript_5807/m.7406 type:complete len:387 (-) Transcript_5807:41-1201(-)
MIKRSILLSEVVVLTITLVLTIRCQVIECLLPPIPMFSKSSNIDKGFNILESATKILPQGQVVKAAKESWKFIWQRMMTELAPQDQKGSYKRPSYSFNSRIGSKEFPDEAGRYHVYVGNPCPWCHRIRLAVALRKLQPDQIGITCLIDDPVKASRGGWVFDTSSSGDNDPLGSNDLRELYEKLSPNYNGRCTAPLLVDLKTKKIISNESSDIVRILNNAELDSKHPDAIDLYPENLAYIIDETNQWVYELLNNGVYRCGFSTKQSAYDEASADVRKGLKKADNILKEQPYLCGDKFTESDLRLIPTIIRFDGAYAALFRAGGAHLRVKDYPHILAWLQRCWDIEGVSSTIDVNDAVSSYYRQLFPLNPGGIIPTPITLQDIGLIEI